MVLALISSVAVICSHHDDSVIHTALNVLAEDYPAADRSLTFTCTVLDLCRDLLADRRWRGLPTHTIRADHFVDLLEMYCAQLGTNPHSQLVTLSLSVPPSYGHRSFALGCSIIAVFTCRRTSEP